MASSTKNVKLGVCRAYFGGEDLGFTQGGVEVTVKTDTHKVELDQFGKTIVNESIMSRNVTTKLPLAETTIRNLVKTMPGAVLVSDGANASATVTFASNPTATTTVTIGGQAFSFQAGKPTTLYQVQIGANLAASMTAFVDTVNRALLQPALGGLKAFVADSVNAPGVVTIQANDPGTLQNAITLAAASGGVASGATLTGGVVETKARVDVPVAAGTSLLDGARLLRLHPTSKADNDFSDDFIIYQAATAGALTFAYKVDAERVYNTEFNGYPDATGKLFSIGDPMA